VLLLCCLSGETTRTSLALLWAGLRSPSRQPPACPAARRPGLRPAGGEKIIQLEYRDKDRETNLDRTQLRTRDATDDHEHNQGRLRRMGMRSVAHERPKHAQACLQQAARGGLPEQVSTRYEYTRDLVKPDSPFGQSGWTQDSPLHVQSVQAYDSRE
jgi:hypothetical protein